ncbi:ubiquitin C-terminal hydrolase L3 [Clohesyomyces aquaticus]|uniref:Ubiquitin carboxyl-terminal hydrolase n=1 Tax=Clohesyomyces aquaticus TaxID=1231657 RepID=A0A1Y1Z812_9PLEO|nr:ubiquitin C-terminal hydrolase L3 [Clohesyomyces aquaticus]
MGLSNPSADKIYRKHFIPLESNPEVFTELIHKLGVSQSLCFQDVLSLDDPELLAFLPRPAFASVLVCATTDAYNKRCEEEEARLGAYEGCGEDDDFVFFKQTINNACGLYGILHAVCNGNTRKSIGDDSVLGHLLKQCLPLKPDERALALEDSNELENVYASVARKGDTTAPESPEDEVDFHYFCFVKSGKNGHLLQMDGERARPIDLGELGAEEDVLSETCLKVIRAMVAESTNGTDLNFALMALVPADHN